MWKMSFQLFLKGKPAKYMYSFIEPYLTFCKSFLTFIEAFAILLVYFWSIIQQIMLKN